MSARMTIRRVLALVIMLSVCCPNVIPPSYVTREGNGCVVECNCALCNIFLVPGCDEG